MCRARANESQIQGKQAHKAMLTAPRGKTAQRAILDLKDKVLKLYDLDEVSMFQNNTNRDEALSALEVLGFVRKTSEKVVDKVISQNPDATVELIIKLALKNL